MLKPFRVSLASIMLCVVPLPVIAGTHTWDVSEVFSNADGTIQFVELKNTPANNEGGVGNGTITSNTKTFSWTNGTVTNTANKFYLVATQGFADLPGAPTPDAIISPASIPFFDASGDSVDFKVYDTCTFGPVPVDGVNSYDCFTTTTGPNSPTNFAGASGSVDASGIPASITLNHVDDFQGGTLQGWSGGSSPTNVADGGPGGTGDRYLELSAVATNLGSFNLDQWSGDYLTEGVLDLEIDLDNSGPAALSLRIMLLTPGCDLGGTACTAWTSTDATVLPSGSGWVTAAFSLDEADLTLVLGSDTYTASLQNVERLLIRHDDGAPSPPGTGTPVTATLGVDNVTALPEPSGLAVLAVGAAALRSSRRARRDDRPR